MRILVVDDDNVSLTKMKAILSKYGEVTTTDSGVKAVELIKNAYMENKPFDLCTMDIEMPEMNGTVAVEKIRQLEQSMSIKDKNIKIIMATIKGNDTSVISSFYNGCEWYIKKPIAPKDIENALMNLDLL